MKICRRADGSVNFFPEVKLWKLCVPRYSFATSFTSCKISAERKAIIKIRESCRSLFYVHTCDTIRFTGNLNKEIGERIDKISTDFFNWTEGVGRENVDVCSSITTILAIETSGNTFET